MVINLDSSDGGGTHWVACYISTKVEYDTLNYSFGLEPQREVTISFEKHGLRIVFNSTQYQNFYSVLCSYFCLYFNNEHNNGRSAYEILYALSNNTRDYFENI